MNLYPAIDLYEGQVVRLERGDFSKKKIYSSDPVAFAKKWENQGAPWLHIVDLEGAKTGVLKNLNSVKAIRKAATCKIQLGGGLRSLEIAESVLSFGIDRVVIGTKAMDAFFLSQACRRFGKQLALGLDIREGIVQTQGWLDNQNPTLETALKFLKDSSIETLIYTDIQKDGMMEGPNFEGLKQVLENTKARVILSGGISSMKDIEACCNLPHKNFEGVIMGKALYENAFQLSEALALVKTHGPS